jgi:hypothetical protein
MCAITFLAPSYRKSYAMLYSPVSIKMPAALLELNEGMLRPV